MGGLTNKQYGTIVPPYRSTRSSSGASVVHLQQKTRSQPKPTNWLLKAFGYGILSVLLSLIIIIPIEAIFDIGVDTDVYTSVVVAFASAFISAAIPEELGKFIWHLAPAYDLTLCTEGYNGQHTTSVNSTGHPNLQDFIAVGTKIKMSKKRCREIFDEVYQNCGDLLLNDITKK